MTGYARESSLVCPATVAIHNDCNMFRKCLWMEVGWQAGIVSHEDCCNERLGERNDGVMRLKCKTVIDITDVLG